MLIQKDKELFTSYYINNEIVILFKKDIIELEYENEKLKNIINDKNIEIEELKLLYFNKMRTELNNNDKTEKLNIKENLENKDLQIKVKELNFKNNEEHKILLRHKNKFEKKELPILERCNVIAYNYDKDLYNNDKELQILEYISSESKILIKFNSELLDKIYNKNDNKDNKSRFKYKYIRCQELYNNYGEVLNKFRIYPDYLGKLTKKEWTDYLLEFDKLYKNTINFKDICKHKYKNGKLCNRICCNINHKKYN